MTTRAARQRKRFLLIAVASAVVSVAVILTLFALNEQIVYFRTPTEIVQGVVEPGIKVRVGGLVEAGSVIRAGETVSFGVTDEYSRFTASFTGILPDLFREGQGIVIEGVLGANGQFEADTVLAKHDENYVPKEVQEALEQQGRWQGAGS